MWHITLPGIRNVIILLLILRLSYILSTGFEQMFLQRNAVGPEAAEVLDTFVYFRGIQSGDWGFIPRRNRLEPHPPICVRSIVSIRKTRSKCHKQQSFRAGPVVHARPIVEQTMNIDPQHPNSRANGRSLIILLALLALLGTLMPGKTMAQTADQPNLVVNGGYESATNNLPDNWSVNRFSGAVDLSVDGTAFRAGSRSARMAASATSRAALGQMVTVSTGQFYEISQWIKTSAITSSEYGTAMRLQFFTSSYAKVGANVMLAGPKGTTDWTQVRQVVQIPDGAARLYLETFFWNATGTAWFDEAIVRTAPKLDAPATVGAYSGYDDKVRVYWTTGNLTSGQTITIYAAAQPLTDANLQSATVAQANVPALDGRAAVVVDANARPYIGLVVRDATGRTSSVVSTMIKEQMLSTLKPQHPRLLVSDTDWERITALRTSDPVVRQWYAKLRADADAILTQSPAQYKLEGKRLLAQSRLVLIRVYTLALVYRVDGDQRYLDRAWQELDAAANFPDWNPSHFLDTAEMTHAFAIGYDWLYDRWSTEQRATLRTAIIEKGLNPALRAYRGDTSGVPDSWFWVTTTINWNVVVNGGISVGALAIADEAPDVSEEVLQYARASIEHGLSSYLGDGAWAEGLNYWNFATNYLVVYLAGLDTALGTDYGITDRPGIAATGFFPIYLTGNAGTFNYGDTWPDKLSSPHLYWLARRFNQPLYSAYEQERATPHPQDVLWYVPSDSTSLQNIPLDKHFDQVQNTTFRSAWDDPNGLYVGFKFSYDVALPAGTTDVPTVTATATSGNVSITPAGELPGTTRLCVQNGTAPVCYTLHFTAPSSAPTMPKLAVASVSASGHDGNVPQNTLDGDLATRWSADGDGQWIQYDLGSEASVNYLEIAFFRGDQRKTFFDIATSSDGTNWTRVFMGESSGTTAQFERFSFKPAQARYVRIVGYGNTVNTFTSVADVTIHGQRDQTAPTVAAVPDMRANAAGWHNRDVTITLRAADEGGSGVTSLTYSANGAQVVERTTVDDATATLTIAAEGETTISYSATDNAGNTSAAGTLTIKLDKTVPAITVTSPTARDYLLGESVMAQYACDDNGSGVTACASAVTDGRAIDTASVGTKTLEVTAEDGAGNRASQRITYRVVYRFTGFFQPIDNLPVLNTVKAGQAIPVKWSLSGDQGLNVLAAGYPKSEQVGCYSTAPVDGVEEAASAGASGLTYDALHDQYTYVWKTEKSWAGTCRQLVVQLADGKTQRANFKFGK